VEEAPDRGESSPPPERVISPYLEERLEVARVSMANLGRELRELGDRWEGLRVAAELLEQEIGNASAEVEYLAHDRADDDVDPPAPALARGAASARPAFAAPPATPAQGPEPYAHFTVARYNRTIGDLKGRRRRLAWWTVVLAGAISAVFVTFSLLAHEPTPVIWLAVLPAIWMIPVPFFLVSFLSTQRVLRRNHLDFPGDP
jgi:hypothetical protein